MPADLALFPAHPAARRSPAAQARHLHPAALPAWRALLEGRWQQQHERVTRLSRACRDARRAAVGPGDGPDARQAAGQRASALWHRAVAQCSALAEIEAALSRLAAGRFGWWQHCGAPIAARTLTQIPQARYCPPATSDASRAARSSRTLPTADPATPAAGARGPHHTRPAHQPAGPPSG